MTYVITRSCCCDTACVAACPVDCIHPGPNDPDLASAEMLYINPDDCIDCGACQSVCPVSAIYPDHALPDHLAPYAALNADYFGWTGGPVVSPAEVPEPPRTTVLPDAPLRVAVVGAGPSGWYAVDELISGLHSGIEVTVVDRNPTPFGLIRHGVAPDHLDTKTIVETFERWAASPCATIRLNVEVGRDVTHDELLAHHHAVIYATGASVGRSLGLPGEDLHGSVSSAELVGWYNGHPDYADCDFDLDHRRAVIIGNGNVALDIARLLLLPSDALRASDMAPSALAGLARSSIKEVVVIGRRGAEHAAFTTPEFMAILEHPDFDVVIDPADLAELDDRIANLYGDACTAASFAARRKVALLKSGASAQAGAGSKRLVLRFGVTPLAVLGSERVAGLRLRETEGMKVEDIEAGLVVSAVGYRSTGIDGLPLDEEMGRFRHQGGRVVDPQTEVPVRGTYTVGWAKRGPQGVIGTNRGCAVETVRTLLDDYHRGDLQAPVGDSTHLDDLLAQRGALPIDLAAWQALDRFELSAGVTQGRPRVKIVNRTEQLRVALADRP